MNLANCSFDGESRAAPVARQRDLVMARKAKNKITSRSAAGAETLLGTLRTLVHDLFHPYRPELHYMRGPGPAWHAKHDPVSVPSSVPTPGLRQAAA